MVPGSPQKHLFIINLRCFRGKKGRLLDKIRGEIRSVFGSLGYDYRIFDSNYPREAIGIINRFMKSLDGDTLVRIYAVGGDGILFDCLNGMVGIKNTELAIIPYGNSNDFIRAFGDDQEGLFRNLEKQATGPSLSTDVIASKGNYALNTASVGFESFAVYNTTRLNKKIEKYLTLPKWLYRCMFIFYAALSATDRDIPGQWYQITLDSGEVISERGSINVANGPCYGGGLMVHWKAEPDDGLLNLLFIRDRGMWKNFAKGPGYIGGKAVEKADCPDYHFRQVRRVDVKSDRPILIDLDGESFFDTDTYFEIIPGAVRIVSPGGFPYAHRISQRELA